MDLDFSDFQSSDKEPISSFQERKIVSIWGRKKPSVLAFNALENKHLTTNLLKRYNKNSPVFSS